MYGSSKNKLRPVKHKYNSQTYIKPFINERFGKVRSTRILNDTGCLTP